MLLVKGGRPTTKGDVEQRSKLLRFKFSNILLESEQPCNLLPVPQDANQQFRVPLRHSVPIKEMTFNQNFLLPLAHKHNSPKHKKLSPKPRFITGHMS